MHVFVPLYSDSASENQENKFIKKLGWSKWLEGNKMLLRKKRLGKYVLEFFVSGLG